MSDDGEKALVTLSGGDMRKVLNVLQSTHMAYERVTEDTVYTCVGHPLRSDITSIVNWMLNEDFGTAYTNIQKLKVLKGLAMQDIVSELHTMVHKSKLSWVLQCVLCE